MMCLWILIALHISELKGYSNGDFPQACDSMLPVHDDRTGVALPPQSSEPPFTVSYQLGRRIEDPITVILKSKGSIKFAGFMLEARDMSSKGEGPPIGTFITLESGMTQLLTCSGLKDSAVSQKLSRVKTEFKVNWTGQREDLDIIFRVTFSQNFVEYWERVNVTLLRPTSTSVPSTPEQTTAATTTAPTTPTTVTTPTAPTTPTTVTTPTAPTTPTTTISTALNTTTFPFNPELVGITLVCLDSIFEEMKMAISNIVLVLHANRPIYYDQKKASMIVCSTLCVANSLWSLFFFFIDSSFSVTYVALVSVVVVITFIELVFAVLPLGHSHELNDVCDLVLRVCFVVHHIFTNVLLFVGVIGRIDESGGNRRETWLLFVMIAFTAWSLLIVVWNFVLAAYKRELQCNKTGNQGCEPQRIKVSVRVILTAVSVILLVGTTLFSVAVIVGLFTIQKN